MKNKIGRKVVKAEIKTQIFSHYRVQMLDSRMPMPL